MADIWDRLEKEAFSVKKDSSEGDIWDRLENTSFGVENKPATRNPFAVANDLVISTANQFLGGAQAVSDFISPNNKFSQGVEELIKEGEAKQSDVVKASQRKLGQALDTEDIGTQLRGVKDFVLENPGQAAAMAAGSFAIPFGAIKGAKGVGQLFGLGEKAASRVALGTGMTTSGVLAGGDAAGDAYQAVMNSPALADRTIEERERLASDAARKASVVPFVLGAASGLVGADRALATGTRSLLKTGAAEFASEAVEEGATKLSANIAADLAGAEVGTFRGVAGAAALGGVLGGGTGLAVGALTKQPDSLLAGSTNISTGQISPDENAVNKAIDANSSELTAPLRPTPTSLESWPDQTLKSTLDFQLAKGRNANVELIQQIDEEIARRGGTEVVDSQAQVRNAQLQQQQQAAQAQQQAAQAQAAQVETLRADVFNKYGGQTTTLPGGTKPVFSFLGKQYFTVNDMNKAVDAVLAKEQTKPPMVREVEGALASVIPVVGAKPYTPAKMASFLNPYLNEAESIAEVADRIDARLASIKPNSPESDTLTALRNVLRGQPAEGNITQLNQGVNDGQLQLQGNAGLRTISEQGGATQTGGTGTGNVRPTGLQSVQPRSIDEGSLGLQVGAVPSGGVPTSASTAGSRGSIPSNVRGQAQDQGQVNGRQPQVTTKKRRSVVPDQAAERARSPEQQSEEEATSLVETVVRNVIDAVVKRRGRMSNVNLQKLKDFIYYDFSQVENRKEGIAGLTKKELAEMFDVSTDTIDGWQDIANNFFEDNRGVIQAQLYQALDASGMSLLELKEQIQATRENVLNDAITLEEGQTLSEVTMEDEADFEQNAIETAAAADQELTEMTTESQLDQRELGAEDSGMTVMTGRKGASVQEQNKPEETINARYLRKSEELAAAEEANDQDLIEKLNKELDELADEAMGVAKKQVAKSEAIAGEKKGTKDAVQKRSPKGVSVREQAEARKGVSSKDTEGGKAATKTKADEEVSALTVAKEPNEIADEQLQEKKKAAEQIGLNNFYTVIDQLNTYENLNEAIYSAEQNAIDTIDEDKSFREKDNSISLSVYNAATNAIAKEVETYTWNALPVPVRYEQLSPQARADWALSVKDGKTNLAAASRVYDENEDNIIAATDVDTKKTIKPIKRAIKARNNQKIIATESQISFLEQLDYTEHSIPGMDDYNGATLEVGLAATDLKSLSDNFPGVKRALFVINSDYPHLFDAIDHVAIGETGNFYQAVVTQELENGNIQTWLVLNKDHLLTSTGTEQAFAMIHEFGHIADMAGNGGTYSNTQQFEPAYQELLDIYTNKTDRELEVILTYPFEGMNEKYQVYENIYLSKEELQQEVFAQLWAIGFNTVLTQKLKTLAPNAYNFIREVYSHAAEKRSVIPGSEAGSKIKTAVLKATFESRYSRSTAPSTSGLPGQPTIPARTGKITLRKAIGQKAKPPELVKNGNKADLVVDGKVVSSFEVIPEKLYNAFKNNPQALANVERDNANYEEATNALEEATKAWQENQPYSRMEKMHIADSYTFYSLLTKATNGTATPEEQLAFDMAENGLRRRGPENYRRSLQPGNSIEESKIKFAKLQQEVNNGATTEQIAEEYAAQRKAPLASTVIRRSRGLKEAREQSQKQMARLPKSVGGPLQALMDNIYGFAKKGLPTFAFTEDLADVASKLLPSAKKYVTLSKERDAIKTKFERQVDKVLQMYDKLPESVKGTGENSVNKLIKDFTMSGKWGYNPGWIKGGVTLDPELKARFEAMPDEAQTMIKAVFTHGQNTLLTMQKSVTENINSEYDALIADAKKSGDKKEEAELTKKKAAALTDYSTLMRTNSKSPYAPLKRFGNYVVVGYSQQYLENEILANSKTATPDVVAEAKKKIRELEKNEDHYFVQFAETRGEARAIAREEEKNYALVDSFEKDQSNSYGGRDVQNMFYRLRNMVEESKDANLIDASEKAMNRLLADLHLTLLSEQSARQSERRRRKIAGAEDDMMRSFATQGRATANFIASLANTGSIYDVLREMKQEADARGGTSTREERRRYYNEFMKRQFMGMEYNPSPYVDKALSVTSMWMLLTNPAYYLQNMTQPFMMSLPSIGAKHGYTKSWKEFTKAYTEIFNVIKDGGLDESTYGKLPADVRSVVEELVNRGRIDISLEQDLGRWRSTEDAKLAKFGRASELLRTLAQNIETVNRVATAVAAYRLESKVSNPTRALNYADKIIYTTHGDYSTGNAPRFTREGIGRLATQFRKFQLIQISLMARLYNDAFRNEDPDTRAIGKRALAFTIGHTAVVGGVMGLPGFYALAAIYGLLFGDDDEPFNAELAMRRAIGNDTIADLLLKGVPAALGVDLSGKLGMGQMLSLFPYSNVDISRKGVYELVGTAVTGPFGALLGKTAEGISYMGKGEYYKGVEQMLPSGLSNVAKAYRFATEGVTNRAGDVLLGKEEIDFVEAMMTALGLAPKQITDRQFLQATKFEFDEFYNDKASEIKRAYTRASKENDTAAQAKAREDWKKLQESRAKNGYTKQPLSSLLKAPQEQRKRERNVAGGVQFNRANKGFVRQTSEL